MKKFNILLCALFLGTQLFSQTVSTFENLPLAADTFWNGADNSGGFSSGKAWFANDYGGGYWSGFVYSNKKDSTTAGVANQYSAITAGGYGGSANYVVGNDYGDAKIRLTGDATGRSVKGFYVTNATYAYLAMKNGDAFAKKFGGPTGTDPDWFRLTVSAWQNGTLKSEKVQFYLADFRSNDSTQDYILKKWAWVDLQALGNVDSLAFHLESTDTAGGFGMNNPAYFVLDNFTTNEQLITPMSGGFEELSLVVDSFWNGADLSGGFQSDNAWFANDYGGGYWSGFVYSNKKDTTTTGVANQYSAITGSGYNGSNNYAIADDYGNAKVKLTGAAMGKTVKGFYVTNATYAYLAMKNGDAFAKKFGGASGTDPDWFNLRVLAWYNGAMKAQVVDFKLADFTSANSADDYIVRDWRWVDLQPLGNVDSLEFHLSSTDTAGGFGMNNPAYFAMDNFTAYTEPEAYDDNVTTTYLNDTAIAVLNNDEGLFADPITVELIGSPQIPGATAVVMGGDIHYTPAVGIVATDTLWYKVSDAFGAADTAKVVVRVTGITAIESVLASGIDFVVYPNPFAGNEVHVVTGEEAIGSEMTVFDLSGKVVNTEKIVSQYSMLNTENLSAGIYFVRLSSANGTSVKKIVKQ